MKRAPQPLSYPGARGPWEQLHAKPGATFEVAQAFEDADGDLHRPGERWTLLGTSFDKAEDVLWLGVRGPGGGEWLMPLDWRKGRQSDVLERWESYVTVVS
jgi:hypothetical protein